MKEVQLSGMFHSVRRRSKSESSEGESFQQNLLSRAMFSSSVDIGWESCSGRSIVETRTLCEGILVVIMFGRQSNLSKQRYQLIR
jgi:hypothetical protein